MVRPNAQLKMEYYPTPACVVELIGGYITTPVSRNTRLLDPCCGQGEALRQLAALLGAAETYGVELNTERAQIAREHLTRALGCSYGEMRAPSNAFQLLFLNPPYDLDQNGKRMELVFLHHSNSKGWLQPSGLLVWIVPEAVARQEASRKYLSAWYEDLSIFRFPHAEYEAFKQVVVFGVQRAKRAAIPPWDIPEDLPVLGRQKVYTMPTPATLSRFYFHSSTPTAEDLDELAGRAPRDFPELTAHPVSLEAQVQPLLPLQWAPGHVPGSRDGQ